MTTILEMDGIGKTYEVGGGFFSATRQLRAVADVSVRIEPGRSLGLVGESGCGKSTLAKAAAGFVAPSTGEVRLAGTPLRDDRGRVRSGRRQAQMIFQDPLAALDARMRVGPQIDEAVETGPAQEIGQERDRLLAAVGLGPAFADRFPHELSGGQRQRVVIARALAAKPKLLICDEPLAALDVSVQAQMLALLRDLQQDFGVSLLFISHQLSIVRHLCDDVAVMYAGRIVESGTARQVFETPRHPYTAMLLSTALDPRVTRRRTEVVGEPPDPSNLPQGCPFRVRCPRAQNSCAEIRPELETSDSSEGSAAACHFPLSDDDRSR